MSGLIAAQEGSMLGPNLEVLLCEAEQQSAINAVVHKLLAVLAQPNVVHPVAHLRHCPVVDVVLHGLLHSCCQSGPAGLQTTSHVITIPQAQKSIVWVQDVDSRGHMRAREDAGATSKAWHSSQSNKAPWWFTVSPPGLKTYHISP